MAKGREHSRQRLPAFLSSGCTRAYLLVVGLTLACAAIARRIHAGLAQPFPNPPPRDAHGLVMAIWA